jgi:hypothetical protein
MKKKILFFTVLFFFNLHLFAKQVSVQDAKQVAIGFFYERIDQHNQTGYHSLKVLETFIKSNSNLPLYYIFNISDQGWVIVSADDAVPPVLAYSFEGSYSESHQSPQFVAWMQQYAGQIEHAIMTNALPGNITEREWKRLLSIDPLNHSAFSGREVQPFITSKWNQSSPYNGMCPADPLGSGGHALVGCVPTAMGQILYYYRWPDTGVGSYTYVDSTYGVQHVDFDSTTYKWDNMKASISTSNVGIAELLYHLGVSCDLVYGPDASGMYNHKAAYSLRTYFKYSPNTQYVFRDSTTLDWDSLIIAHLDRRMPLYYAGWSVPNIMGHAFVCDGYQGTDYFHFNFGWGGSSDGYFLLDYLTPGGNNFNLAQELIINCYPDTINYQYPAYCTGGTNIINFKEGTIDDGSGPLHNYPPMTDCNWLLTPQTDEDSISDITLTFNNFDISTNDSVIIYDGNLQTSTILGSFSGNTLPSPITSTGNTLLVRFKANGGTPAPGWTYTYSSTSPVWCKGTTTLTADTAEVSDGSFRFNYHNNSNCKWKFLPADMDTLTIYFKSFDTEPDMDVLKIYDLDSQALLASISGHYDDLNPPPPVTSPSGKMFLIFTSNSSGTGKGWEIFYPKSTIGIRENTMQGLTVFPNPARDRFYIELNSVKYQRVTLELISVTGEQLFMETFPVSPGKVKRSVGTSSLSKGIYFLKIMSDGNVEMRKIIVD